MPLTLDILRSTSELQALVPEWTALWLSADRAKPFQHPAWLVPWWHHFGQPDLRVITLRASEDGHLVGLLPLYIYREPASGERQLLLLGAGTSDYLDGVFLPVCTPDDVAAALRLIAEDNTWDVMHLTQLLPDRILARAAERLGPRDIHAYPGEPTSWCPAAPISALPATVRREVLFCRNAAIAHGKLDLVAAAADSLSAAFEDLVQTHTERWQQMGESGVLADPAVLAWHREALPLLLEAGMLRLLTLRLDGTALATMYSLVDPPGRTDRTQYLYLMGHDLRHAGLQPGRLLTAYTLEHAASEGVRTVDMLRGEEAYKRFWRVKQVATLGFAIRRS